MRRPNIIEAIKKGLASLPLDIEVWLYGSEARGDARPDSDIDLLVLFNKPKVTLEDESEIYNVTTPIEWDCGVAINPMIYSKLQWESRMTPFRLNVINDGIKIGYSTLFKQRLSGDYDDMFDNTLETVNELYPKAQEFIAAVKEKVDIWLAENKV